MQKNLYVNFGCGGSTSKLFLNFDASPRLYAQRLPVLGALFQRSRITFPKEVMYGDIVKGLPVQKGSCKGIFSSHVLEHLSYNDCQIAIKNSYAYLMPGGIFRCVLPNFEAAIRFYLQEKSKGNVNACNEFLTYSFLGRKERPKTFGQLVKSYFSGSEHLWMWDYESLKQELQRAGFNNITRSGFHQSADRTFDDLERESRFEYDALCVEATK